MEIQNRSGKGVGGVSKFITGSRASMLSRTGLNVIRLYDPSRADFLADRASDVNRGFVESQDCGGTRLGLITSCRMRKAALCAIRLRA